MSQNFEIEPSLGMRLTSFNYILYIYLSHELGVTLKILSGLEKKSPAGVEIGFKIEIEHSAGDSLSEPIFLGVLTKNRL